MRHQLAHRDLAFAVRAELGPVIRDRLFEPDFPLLDQLHHRRGGGDYLGQRCEVEDGVHPHRQRPRHDCPPPESPPIYDLALGADQDHCAGALAVLDRLLDNGSYRRERSRALPALNTRSRRAATRFRLRRVARNGFDEYGAQSHDQTRSENSHLSLFITPGNLLRDSTSEPAPFPIYWRASRVNESLTGAA